MEPLTQVQVQAVEAAAIDADRHYDALGLAGERRRLLDARLWDAHVLHHVPVATLARLIGLGRGSVRHSIERFGAAVAPTEEEIAEQVLAVDGEPSLWPPAER
jgi:hypothetical protein